MLKSYLNNWTLMRLIRTVLSVLIIIQAISIHDIAMSLVGIVLLGMALANIGCCGSGGCATPAYKKGGMKKEEFISYEEVV